EWVERDEERRALGQEQREWLLGFADGAPGRFALAQAMGLFGWWRTLSPMLDEAESGAFPAELGKAMADLVEQYAQAWVDQRENASKDAANKDGARQLFALLAHRARLALRDAASDLDAQRAL